VSALVTWIHVAPIKALAIQELVQVDLGPLGVENDRRFCIVDPDGRMLNAKRVHLFVAVKPHFDDSLRRLVLDMPDGTKVEGSLDLGTATLVTIYGRSVLQTHLFAGGSVFFDPRTAFPRIVMETLASEGCTGLAGVPLTFEIIRRAVDLSTLSFPRLRYLTQAGGPMSAETIAWVRRAFHPAKLFVMYGQTEATARLSYLPPARADDKAGSIGIPIPGVELRVVDDLGQELPTEEEGHLVARGENVTRGYLDEPEETAAILRDGWLWTGDLAYRDADGFFFHRGRAKEILKIGGHRVSPVEIEQIVMRHPDVADAAVIGLKQDLMGEVPAALVVVREGRRLVVADVQRFCREHLPAFKVPASVIFVEALPRNEAGKLLRTELAARYGGVVVERP